MNTFYQTLDLINDLKLDLLEVNNRYDLELDELDFTSPNFSYRRAVIEDERQKEIREILEQVPNISFSIDYGDDIVTISALNMLYEDIDLCGIEKVEVIE